MTGLLLAATWRQTLSDAELIGKTSAAVLAGITAWWALLGRRVARTLHDRRIREIEQVVQVALEPIARDYRFLRRDLRRVAQDLDEHRQATEGVTDESRAPDPGPDRAGRRGRPDRAGSD